MEQPRNGAPESPLSGLVDIKPASAKKFEKLNSGRVVDFQLINDSIIGVAETDETWVIYVQNERGKREVIYPDPHTADILNTYRGDYIDANEAHKVMVKLGYTETHATIASQIWEQKATHVWGRSQVNTYSARGYNQFYLKSPNAWMVETDAAEKAVVLTSDGIHYKLDGDKLTALTDEDYSKLTGSRGLQDGLELDILTENSFEIVARSGKVLQKFTGSDVTISPIDQSVIYFINTGSVYKIDLSGIDVNKLNIEKMPQIQIVNPREIEMDPHGNFLIVRDEKNVMSILDVENGAVIKTIEGVKGPIDVDSTGNIFFVDTNDHLRELETNFQVLPKGGSKIAQVEREERLKKLKEKLQSFDVENGVPINESSQLTEKRLADEFRAKFEADVLPKLEAAKSPEDLEKILDTLHQFGEQILEKLPRQVVEEYIGKASEKLSQIRTTELAKGITRLRTRLNSVKNVGDTLRLEEEIADLYRLRQTIEITDIDARKRIDEQLESMQKKKDALIEKQQGQLVETIGEVLPEIEALIKETGSLLELQSFEAGPQSHKLELMLMNVRDLKKRTELRNRVKQLKQEQRMQLQEKTQAYEEEQRQRYALVIEESRSELEPLKEEVSKIPDIDQLEHFKRHPSIIAWRARLLMLPQDLREVEEARLDLYLDTKEEELKHRRELGMPADQGLLRFGDSSFPIYKETQRVWRAKVEQLPDSLPGMGRLFFEDSVGNKFYPGGEEKLTLVSTDLQDQQTKEIIGEYQKEADEYFKGIKRRVPPFDEHWVISDFQMKKLEELVEVLNLQLEHHRGITILSGDAGTGKNVLIDMLANQSNREVITIPCNRNTIREDLTYEFYFDPKKGTYKLPSTLVEGIQTPGTIILFDEINTLPPGVSKMLNSLFDYRRRLYITEGGQTREVVVDPTVIFVGTMNPQHYQGVANLSPEVKSRSRVVEIGYPPFETHKGGRLYFYPYEGLLLSRYTDKLNYLKPDEFIKVWNYVINRDAQSGGEILVQGDPKLDQELRKLHEIVMAANHIRQMYISYQMGESNIALDFPMSMRETIDIVLEMQNKGDVKQVIKRVILPKIDDPQQRNIVDQALDSVLP